MKNVIAFYIDILRLFLSTVFGLIFCCGSLVAQPLPLKSNLGNKITRIVHEEVERDSIPNLSRLIISPSENRDTVVMFTQEKQLSFPIRTLFPLGNYFRGKRRAYTAEEFYKHIYGTANSASSAILQGIGNQPQLFTALLEGTIFSSRIRFGTLLNSSTDSLSMVGDSTINSTYLNNLLSSGGNFALQLEYPLIFTAGEYHTFYMNAQTALSFYPEGYNGNVSNAFALSANVHMSASFHPKDKEFGVVFDLKLAPYFALDSNYANSLGMGSAFFYGQFSIGVSLGDNISLLVSTPFNQPETSATTDPSDSYLFGFQFKRNLSEKP